MIARAKRVIRGAAYLLDVQKYVERVEDAFDGADGRLDIHHERISNLCNRIEALERDIVDIRRTLHALQAERMAMRPFQMDPRS